MSSKFSLQTPYVVASLPRPIDHSNGRYVVGEVFGGAPGSKKRKRSELVVGVDGEGVNIYDISSSRLITSYALPPQTSFTCAPASTRTRISKSKVERRTYVSTAGPQSQISLFSEITEGSANTSTTKSLNIGNSQEKVVFMGTITASRGSDVTENTSDLLIVKEDGEIQCFDGDELQQKWTSPASALHRESTAPTLDAKVEFTHLTNAFTASQGILKGRQDVFALFPREISEDGFNPDILFIITKSHDSRNIHMVTVSRRAATQFNGLKHSVESLLTTNLPTPKDSSFPVKASFSLQVSAGILQQLSLNRLTTFDMSETIPKELSQVRSGNAQSFLRLSNTSIIVSSDTSIHVYNPKFHSMLASVQLNEAPTTDSLKRKRIETEGTNENTHRSCSLVSYFPKLSTVVGILDNDLVGIQIESQGKGRATGLLIDSLGCSIPGQHRPGRNRREGSKKIALTTMDSYLPGSIEEGEDPWEEQIKLLDGLFAQGEPVAFDSLMMERFEGGTTVAASEEPLVNGFEAPEKSKCVSAASEVDKRWVIYALSKMFAWSKEDSGYSLSVPFYAPKSFNWILKTGNMTITNIQSALRNDIRLSNVDSIPLGELVDAIVEIDPDMDLLLALLARNFLGAGELLSAIRHLMESLELLGDNSRAKQRLLTNGEDGLVNGDVEEQVEKLEAEAEADLALAEYQLGPGSGVRGEALSLALSKLYTCPANTIVHALQTTFSNQEVVALIYLLRYEMARGAWTTRYLDAEQSDVIDGEADIPDKSIILVSSLLNNCIDAVGAGGWLSGDARLVNGDPFEAEELIASLKLEVSAALEGIEEAAYLRGLTSEMIRYGDAIDNGLMKPEMATPGGKQRNTLNLKPVLLASTEQDMTILPLGLKADQRISRLRVGAGGEVQLRTARDIGHLKSQKVGKYSLERIIV